MQFKIIGAQGELTIRRIGDLPKNRKLPNGFTAMKAENGRYVIGHSETHHDHVIDAAGAIVGIMDKPPEGMRILYMILENPLVVEHLRDYDTHEPITAEPGVYEVRVAREYDPYAELARLSAD